MSSKKAAQATTSIVKLWVPAGQATPTPPIGPALGQKGVKAIDFCKQYNDKTKDIIPGTPMRTQITIKPDRTFSFVVRPPTTAFLLKRAAGIEKAASEPGHQVAGKISLKHVYEIAKMKQADPQLHGTPLWNICTQIIGSARSMGIQVIP